MPVQPNFPFAGGQNLPGQLGTPSVPAPWLGGMLVPVSAGAYDLNKKIAHGLHRMPRFCWVMDIGKNPNTYYDVALTSPLPRGVSTPWDFTNIYLQMPAISFPILLFVA